MLRQLVEEHGPMKWAHIAQVRCLFDLHMQLFTHHVHSASRWARVIFFLY
jgi:hypothetical protein